MFKSILEPFDLAIEELYRLKELELTMLWNSYNKYLSVAARVVRRSLKDDKRLAAERRGEMELRFAKWNVSVLSGGLYRSDF
jgi:Mitochondrial ATP synthase epsilon chain